MTDDPVPELTITQTGPTPPVASLDAVTMLVHSFGSMIANMERRITERITENAAASKERWARWERDFEKYRDATDRRLELLEGRVHRMEEDEEHEAEVWDARVGPIRNGGMIIARNWKNIALILLALASLFGISADAFGKLVGA